MVRQIVPNLRDLGGVPTTDGGAIASGRLLRSAAPLRRDRTPDGLSWPPEVVIDLRSPDEAGDIHPLARSGSRIVNLPLLSALRPSDADDDTLAALYRLVLDDASMYLVELVREVGQTRGPALVHCAAGKDRTGISIALLLRLAGVGRDAVVGDYLRTADHHREIDARLRKTSRRLHRLALPASYFSVSQEAIDGVLDVWDAHDDGVEGWFRAVGGDDDLVAQLRRTLIA